MTRFVADRLALVRHESALVVRLALPVSLWILTWSWSVAAQGPEAPLQLDAFRVEGTKWDYGRVGGVEVLSQTSRGLSRHVVRSIVRAEAVFPPFVLSDTHWPTRLILLDGEQVKDGRPPPMEVDQASLRYWGMGYFSPTSGYESFTDEETHVFVINYSGTRPFVLLPGRVRFLLPAQHPRFPAWVVEGLIGESGCFARMIGVRKSESVRLPKVSWPDGAVEPGVYPSEAFDFPEFEVMFDPSRHAAAMADGEAKKFRFQAGVFARWSLFGPAKNGRNRNGYWAFAELARRRGVTEDLFKECYGMDWSQARGELRAFIKPKNLGIIEVRMPHVMREVPEVDAMEFREATPEEVRRILGEFNRLRAAQPKQGATPRETGPQPAG